MLPLSDSINLPLKTDLAELVKSSEQLHKSYMLVLHLNYNTILDDLDSNEI